MYLKLSVIFLTIFNVLIFIDGTKIILVEDAKACFRRVLAGKRVADSFVKKSVPCERLDDCQRECNDEKRFVCEGFNYRLDQTGRGQGVCELIELPLSRLDIGRDVYPDKDYDFYERDRDSISPDCRPNYSIYSSGPGWSPPPRRPYDDGMEGGWTNRRPIVYPDNRYPPRPSYEVDHYHPPSYDDRRYNRRPYPDYPAPLPPPPAYKPSSYEPYLPSRDYYYSKSDFHRSQDRNFYVESSYRPLPPPPSRPPYYSRPSYENRRYLPEIPDRYFSERERDRNYWGLNKYRGPMQHHWASYGGSYGNFGKPDSVYYDRRYLPKPTVYPTYDEFRKPTTAPFVPYQIGHGDTYRPPPNWGQYGGSYGNSFVDKNTYDYWGLDRNNYSDYGRYSGKPTYLPNRYGSSGDGYAGVTHYVPPRPSIPPPPLPPPSLPPHPLPPPSLPPHPLPPVNRWSGNKHYYDEPNRSDCSFRSGTGLRMQKGYVRKFYAVPNIYECEKLCFMEKHFPCYSYSFRYTITPDAASENCYLSDRPISQTNMYMDTEPDRNFDIYSMNQGGKQCMQPDFNYGRQSDCFWRTRSGQRLDHSVVRDSLNVRSIGQCELECIRSNRFVCRSFSFRYGSPVIGGPIDNCQLTDWPYSELDPKYHLVPDPGFELYERGSYGHGCELNHFVIQGPWNDPHKMNVIPTESQKRCYIGYGRPAKLLPSAIRKAITVLNEEECQLACTRKREQGPSTCMSFSFRTSGESRHRLPGPNCELSDISQQDLLLNLDYAHDPDYWLFAWDIFNPHCSPSNSRPPPHLPRPPAPLPRPPPTGPYPPPSRPETPGGYPPIDRNDFGIGENTWQHYTVKGLPCRRGSRCERNVILGYYSCEIEGGEVGSWDYCCRPSHPCGYSEGFDYPWCYVGPSRDQWRKCNDRYYPYGHGTDLNKPYYTPASRPYLPKPIRPALISYDVRDKPWIPHPGPSIDRFDPHHPGPSRPHPPADHDNDFLDPPKPGGLGEPRYWPVAYLHKEPPPFTNKTENDKPKSRYPDDDGKSRQTQSRMMMPKEKTKPKPSDDDDDDFVRIDIIPKPESTNTSKDDEFLSYEVINTTDLPADNTTTTKKSSEEEDVVFETVENVDTDDLFSETNSTTPKPTEEKKVSRRGSIVFVPNPRTRARSLFQTSTGNLPSNFQQRLIKERNSLTVVQ